MSNDAASVPSRLYSSVSVSGSVALTGSSKSVPAAVFSATSRSVDAPSTNAGAVLARSSSATAMLARSNSVPSSDPTTSIVRPPSTAALSTAVTVTSTEGVSAGSSTWWPASFASASTGLTP